MPKVTSITVNAGRVFSHPYEDYSNLRPSVSMTAELAEGEDYTAAVKQLQATAEQLVEDHKNALLTNLREIRNLTAAQQKYASLASGIETMQRDLERLRKENPALQLLGAHDDDTSVEIVDRPSHDW